MKFTLSTTQDNQRGDSIALELMIIDGKTAGALVFQHHDGDQVELPVGTGGSFTFAIEALQRELGRVLALACESADDADTGG